MTLAELGVVASVQPMFDDLRGGAGDMYATRLGAARSLAMNPFATMARAGVALAFGSDSPVTPFDPWGAVRAAAWHHNAAERLSVAVAFAAHTRGGWYAARRDDAGILAPGAPASYAIWDVDPEAADPATSLPNLRPGCRCRGACARCPAVARSSTCKEPWHEAQARSRSRDRTPGPGLASAGRPADRHAGQAAHHGVGGAGDPAAGRLARRRPRRHPVGQPPRRRRPRRRRARARRRAAGLGRPAPRRGRGPETLAQKAAAGSVAVPAPRGQRRQPRPRGGPPPVGAGLRRIDAPRASASGSCKRYGDPRAAAVDLPHRRHRRHLRGHPAGPGRRPRGRRRHRGDPLDRPVAARLRARGRHPRGLRRHLRHAGELPADARRPRRVERASSAATSGSPTTPPGCACPRSRRWPVSSGST